MPDGRLIDMCGKRFGTLVVQKRAPNHSTGKGGAWWICRCDCGVIKDVNGYCLRAGQTKTCGGSVHRGGNIPVNRLPHGESAFNYLFGSYRRRARYLSLPFELTKDEFRGLIFNYCLYCGSPPLREYRVPGRTRLNGKCIANGVDRIDNTMGYVLSNCVTCCATCNRMKGVMSMSDFFIHIGNIFDNFELLAEEHASRSW